MPEFFRWRGGDGWVREDPGAEVLGFVESRAPLSGARCVLSLPPLWDHHGHLYWHGALLEQADLRGSRSLEEALARLRRAEASLPPGAWLEGFGWDQNQWGGAFPDRRELDALFPDRPAYLRRIDGHAGWASGAALRAAGVEEAAPNPEGGLFVREGGRMTGILLDRAMELVGEAVPKPGAAAVRRRLALALGALRGAGLCGATDMGIEEEHLSALAELETEGLMPVPADGFFWVRGPGQELPPPRDGRFRLLGAKFFADGALGSRGAALREAYDDDPGNRGLLLWETGDFSGALKAACNAGLAPAVHAIGDRALAQVLDAMEAAGCGPSSRIEHAQLAGEDDLLRMARLGVTASIQPCHILEDEAWAPARLGPRMRGAYRWGSIRGAGVPLLCGSDFPIAGPDPRLNLLACLTRQPASERLPFAALLAAHAPPPGRVPLGARTLVACEFPSALGSPEGLMASSFHAFPSAGEGA